MNITGKVNKNDKVSRRNTRWQADIEYQWYNHGGMIFWCWFSVHAEMEGPTGFVLTMVKLAIQTISIKQNINTKSYKEKKLVSANYVLSHFLWANNFLKQQGYYCYPTLYQYNTSGLLLETNGMESSIKRTQHINIQLYYIKDHIICKELNLKQCSTDDMISYFPIKPLQESKFNKFKNKLMGMNK